MTMQWGKDGGSGEVEDKQWGNGGSCGGVKDK